MIPNIVLDGSFLVAKGGLLAPRRYYLRWSASTSRDVMESRVGTDSVVDVVQGTHADHAEQTDNHQPSLPRSIRSMTRQRVALRTLVVFKYVFVQ